MKDGESLERLPERFAHFGRYLADVHAVGIVSYTYLSNCRAIGVSK